MIDKLVDCGFEVAEINAKVKAFKNNGITKKTIQTLLSDAKSMYLSDDVVKVIGQNTGNSDLLACLVLKNGDDFSNALLKTTVLDDFCDLAWKYGDDVATVFSTYIDDSIPIIQNYGGDVIESIVKYGDDTLNVIEIYGDDAVNYLKQGLTPEEILKYYSASESIPSSKVLRNNMIAADADVPTFANAAHHIVAGSAKKAADAREILKNTA